jgi:proline iminopeptidase
MLIKVNGTELFVTRPEPPRHSQRLLERLPTLVMHGGLGWDHTYLRRWFDPLSDSLDLVYFDHRGNGRSARPTDWSAITHQTWVEDADSLCTALGFEQVLLIGHSYGSFLALEFALAHPERLLGLVLCASAPVLDYLETAVANARARATEAEFSTLMKAMGTDPPRTDTEMQESSEFVLPVYLHDPASSSSLGLLDQVSYSRDAFVHAMSRCLPQYDVRDRLQKVTVPTLVISGADDWLTPPEFGGGRVSQGIPNSEHVVFSASGHFPFAEEPEAFQGLARDWLNRNALLGPSQKGWSL